jgi:2,4-dienoyl-CoA reductase-like NADH-dependent reductase (Old Yellow Enzyme family)
MASLFTPLTLRSVTLRNRVGVSPMCQYSSGDGVASDWHLVHLGSRAIGGAGLVFAEATAVSAEGRITPGCAGIWADKHVEPLARITRFIKSHGAVPALQIAHAGRKGSAAIPSLGGAHLSDSEGGWPTLAPSAVPFGGDLPKIPRAMTEADIARVQAEFAAAAVTSPMNSCLLWPTGGPTVTAAVWKTGCASSSKRPGPSAPAGRRVFPSRSGSPARTGSRAAGTSTRASNFRAG